MNILYEILNSLPPEMCNPFWTKMDTVAKHVGSPSSSTMCVVKMTEVRN
jgi:hypothetical protein